MESYEVCKMLPHCPAAFVLGCRLYRPPCSTTCVVHQSLTFAKSLHLSIVITHDHRVDKLSIIVIAIDQRVSINFADITIASNSAFKICIRFFNFFFLFWIIACMFAIQSVGGGIVENYQHMSHNYDCRV